MSQTDFTVRIFLNTTDNPARIPRTFTTVPTTTDGYVWSGTLIVVVAVVSYLALSFVLCIIYRCARRHGLRTSLNCPKLSCPISSCLNNCTTDIDDQSSWWKRPVPRISSLFDQCCPQQKDVPKCSGFKSCFKGCQKKWPKWCKTERRNGCGDTVCKGCFGVDGPQCGWCKNFCEDSCCGYGGGNCRFCCLECKVRARTKGMNNGGGPLATEPLPTAPYPMQPGMPFNYPTQTYGFPAGLTSNQPFYWNNQQPNMPIPTTVSPFSTALPVGSVRPVPLPSISGNVPANLSAGLPANFVPSWIPPRPPAVPMTSNTFQAPSN
ncbi:hypothetical protein BV898_08247 [Hypsibius exemplaris]|uniref:Uncharacterized protein n=1 Tax=Hypsibius exemplaris TaxID=2072580 RepID=A0A1W0WR11_HYPEX|nr:hypothetical protein BV898_08247 [Hypsibius exemplaris]